MRIATEPAFEEVAEIPSSPVVIERLPAADSPSILHHWEHSELLQAGFDASEIEKLRRADQETLLHVWPDIDEAKLDLVLRCMEGTPETVGQEELLANEEAENARFREAIVERGALAGLSVLLSPDEFERLMSAPIEEWMVFLHPDQRALVDRRFNGPARVRGAAGTGKTVVALHRAAALAARYSVKKSGRPSVLFTTFISTLPPVFENLYARLPRGVAGGVEFINVDKLALRLCAAAGQRVRVGANAATLCDRTRRWPAMSACSWPTTSW